MSRTGRLTVVLVLNLALVTGLIAAGVTAGSLAVLAEGGDCVLDAGGVGVALLAIRLSARPDGHGARSRHPDATSVAALINGGWLLVLEALVAVAAIDRLVAGSRPVAGLPVLVASGAAALVLAVGALVLHGDGADDESGERDLSVSAVLLDTVADAAAAAGVAAAGGVILATGGWYWLDPAVALAISIIVGWHAFALVRKVLLQRSAGRRTRSASRPG